MAFQQTLYWQNEDNYHCGIFGHSFIRRICARLKKNPEEASVLPWSGEAFGTGGLTLDALLKKMKQQVLGRFDIIFVQIGENDVLSMNNHELLHGMLRIHEECKLQGVKHVCFGTLFPRHQRSYNQRQRRFNVMMPKIRADLMWIHCEELTSVDSISTQDHVHLTAESEKDFITSIASALESFG